MAKKPEKRRVQYRVKKKAFVNGTLYEPGAIIDADEGLESKALELVRGANPVAPETQSGGAGDGQQ